MARILSQKQQQEFFEILGNPHNFNTDVFVKLFAWTKAGNGIRFYPDDIITIGPEESKFVKPGSQTTCGCYIINKFIIEQMEVFGYINAEFGKSLLGKIDDVIAVALRDKTITRDQYDEYTNRSQWLYGGPLAHIINPSLSKAIMTLPPDARKLRDKMMAERKERLDANDPEASAEIEQAVVTAAMKDIRASGDPSLAIFDAGGVDPYNNYRTMFVMKGAVQDNTGESPTGYKIVRSNYDDGITKEDMPIIADTLVRSSYMSGVATQDSGAAAKSLNTISQRVSLLPKGSFCGTTHTDKVIVTKGDLYRYIKNGGKKPFMLTSENIGQFLGKEVEMYTPFGCTAPDPHYCNVCMGDNPYLVGVKNIGLTFNIITGSTMNAALKTKHKTKVELYKVTIDDILKYLNHPLV